MNDQAQQIPQGSPAAAPAAGRAIDPSAERGWGTITHVVPLAATILSAGTLGFVGSLVIYLLYKDRGPFVRANAANSLNIQITTGIVLLLSFPLMLLLVGFLTYPLALVYAVAMLAVGAIKANNVEWWDPPLTLRLVR